MVKYILEIKLISDTLIGSGESGGAIIDTDVVFDDIGLPFIPAKRIKGLLKDSASQVIDIFKTSGIKYLKDDILNIVFGSPGTNEPAPVCFSNLYIEEYESNYKWIKYFQTKHKKYFSRESTENAFTSIRNQTKINEDGIVEEHSLRTIRVINKGLTFKGDIITYIDDENYEKLLTLACINLRNIGTKRNRGYGEVECFLYTNMNPLNEKYINEIEKCIA